MPNDEEITGEGQMTWAALLVGWGVSKNNILVAYVMLYAKQPRETVTPNYVTQGMGGKRREVVSIQ
jgi:hypothetical protein